MALSSSSFIRVIGFTLLAFSSSMWAQAPRADTDHETQMEESRPQGDFWKYQELDEDLHSDPVSESFEYILNTSHRFANWADSFFDDDRTVGIKNTTRIKLSAWTFLDGDSSYDDSDFNFNIRVKLPRTQKRASAAIARLSESNHDISSRMTSKYGR